MINKSYSSLSDREAMSGASGVFKGWNLASFVLGAFNFIIGIAALPLRIILRDNIGERSIRPFSFLLAIGVHIFYFTKFDVLIGMISVLGINGDPFQNIGYEGFIYLAVFILINPYSLFLFWSMRRAVRHFKQKIRQVLSDEVSYTYHRGESRFFSNWDKPTIYGFETNSETIRILAEPKAVMAIGLAMAFASSLILVLLIFIFETESVFLVATIATFIATGLVVALDALCLAIDEISLALNKRDKLLDILDSEEDAKFIVSQKDAMKANRRIQESDEDEMDIDNDFVQE